jgi:penicillin amidase
MRHNFVVVCLSSAFLAACAGSQPAAVLTITPSGTQVAAGPTTITASEADVTWTVTGAGTLSGTSGIAVIYRPVTSTTPGIGTVTATTTDGRSATVTFTDAASSALIPGGRIPGMLAAASVSYDINGIPHIFCATAIDCFAVQGFLHAQDRLFEMDLFRRTARGTLSTLIGSLEVPSDEQFLALFSTRDGKDVTAQMAAAIDPSTEAKLAAYVKGVNAYLAFLTANPSLMPGEYAQLPGVLTPGDVPAWTEADSFAIGRLQQFQLSETIEEETAYGVVALAFAPTGRYSTYVRAQQPIRDYTIPLPAAPAPAAVPATPSSMDLTPWAESLAAVNAQMREMHAFFGTQRLGAGSNNWVVDGAHSATGKAMVANDPHLQLEYPPLFHLSAMTSALASDNLDVAGGSFPGVPGALVGRGAHVGWGVTVVGYDVTDLYLEKMNFACAEGHGAPCVIFKGANVPTIPVTHSIAVRGVALPVSFTVLIVPHHGPIISLNAAKNTAVSMRWTGHEATNDFLGFFGLNTATAVGTTTDAATATTAFGALRNYAIGAQNFVMADDQGNIGYDPHAFVPVRPWVGQPNGTVGFLLPWQPLPGDDGTAEWGPGGAVNCAGTVTAGNAPGASCWVADALLPQSVNPAKGFLVTANSDPAGYTDTNNPILNPVHPGLYLSFDWDDPTTVRFETITKFLTAKTTTGTSKVSIADMQTIQSDHSIQLADLFLDPVKAPQFPTANTTTNANALAALAMLNTWKGDNYLCPTGLTGTSPSSAASTDPVVLRDSAACLLFHQFVRTLLPNVFNDDFAAVANLTGTNPGADFGRQLRAMLFMLTLAPNATGTEYCNNVNTSAVTTLAQTCAQQVVTALSSAFTSISAELGAPPAAGATTTSWLWGKFHTLTTLSPAAPLISGGFSGGPFARPGGALSVDVGNPDSSQSTPLGFTYSHGSNVRFVSEVQTSTAATNTNNFMQLPGVEHDAKFGVFSSTHDLLTDYAGNVYFNYLMGHQVDNQVVSSQGFAKP